MKRFWIKIRTSFGSCICNYVDKNSGDTSQTSESIESDSVKDDITKLSEG